MKAVDNQRGAVFVTVALAIPLIVALILYVTHMYRVFQERARMQELADVSAASAASMQARTLNAIALINDALIGMEGLAAGVFLGGNYLGVNLDALLITAPEGVTVHQESFQVANQLLDLSKDLARFQDVLLEFGQGAPILGAQAPLLFEQLTPVPLLLPFPLSGIPVEEREFGFANLLAQANDFALSAADRAMGGAMGGVDDSLEHGAKACKVFLKGRKVAGAGEKVSAFLFGKKKRKRFHVSGSVPAEALAEGCKRLTQTIAQSKGPGKFGALVKDSMNALSGGIGKAADSSGFPPPLALNHDYSGKYQVAVLAVRCKPWLECDGKKVKPGDYMTAVAQARPFSNAQREGGDLLVADFAARLVPVTILDDLMKGDAGDPSALQSVLSQGPWAIRH